MDFRSAKMFKTATDNLGLSGMTMCKTRHNGAGIDRVRGFRTLQEVQRRGRWKAFNSVTRYDKSSRLAADYHSVAHSLQDKVETPAQRSQGIVDKATASPAAHKRMTGKSVLDVFGGSVFLTKAAHRLGLRGYVLARSLVPDVGWVFVAMCSTRSLVPDVT